MQLIELVKINYLSKVYGRVEGQKAKNKFLFSWFLCYFQYKITRASIKKKKKKKKKKKNNNINKQPVGSITKKKYLKKNLSSLLEYYY